MLWCYIILLCDVNCWFPRAYSVVPPWWTRTLVVHELLRGACRNQRATQRSTQDFRICWIFRFVFWSYGQLFPAMAHISPCLLNTNPPRSSHVSIFRAHVRSRKAWLGSWRIASSQRRDRNAAPGSAGSASIQLQDLSKRPMWLFNNWVTWHRNWLRVTGVPLGTHRLNTVDPLLLHCLQHQDELPVSQIPTETCWLPSANFKRSFLSIWL